MTDVNIFEAASRAKLRFPFPSSGGVLTMEDLWDLPLTARAGRPSLDEVARAAHQQLKAAGDDVSFVEPAAKVSHVLQLTFDVVKRVIDVRIAERDSELVAAKRKERNQRIMAIIDQKKDEALSSATLEELHQMLEAV